MAAGGVAVLVAEDRVHVDDGLVFEAGDVSGQGEDLDLLIGEGRVVHLLFCVQPGGGGTADCTDASEVGVRDVVFCCEIGEAAQDFVSFEKDDYVDFFVGRVFE